MTIYKMKEWQGASGLWYCNNVDELALGSGNWWLPSRVLGITPAELIERLVKVYNVDRIHYNKEKNFLNFAWTSEHYADCHKFVLYVNRMARNKNIHSEDLI